MDEHRSEAPGDEPGVRREDVYVIVERGPVEEGLGDDGYVGLRRIDDRDIAFAPLASTAAPSGPDGDGPSEHDRVRLQQSAARLRVVLDEKLGRPTPEYVKKLAVHRRP